MKEKRIREVNTGEKT